MKKAGKLKRLSDLKEFWELMLDLPTPHPPTPRLSVKKATPTLHEPHPRPAEDDDENEEYKSWALTDLPPEHNVKVTIRCSRASYYSDSPSFLGLYSHLSLFGCSLKNAIIGVNIWLQSVQLMKTS